MQLPTAPIAAGRDARLVSWSDDDAPAIGELIHSRGVYRHELPIALIDGPAALLDETVTGT